MRERNHIVRVHLNDREMAHLEKCLSKTHWGKEAFPSPLDPTHPRSPTSCRSRLSDMLECAECNHIPFHGLRHIFSTMALENGLDIKNAVRRPRSLFGGDDHQRIFSRDRRDRAQRRKENGRCLRHAKARRFARVRR